MISTPTSTRYKNNVFRCVVALFTIFLLISCSDYAESGEYTATPQTTTIPDGSVIIPWDNDEDGPVVSAFINGKGPFRFLIDTGASTVVLDQKLVNLLNLPRTGEIVEMNDAGDNMVSSQQPALVDILDLSGAQFSKLQAHVYDFSTMVIDGDMPIQLDGILGSSLFMQALLTIDYPVRKISLTNGHLPEADGKEIFPIQIKSFIPCIYTRLETETQTQDRQLLIDTGSDSTIQIPASWNVNLLMNPIQTGLSMMASGIQPVHESRIARVRIAKWSVDGPEVNISPTGWMGSIGQGLLESMCITFDLSGQRIRMITKDNIITHTSRTCGFSARPCRRPGNEGWIVSFIVPGSQAADKLRLNDRIIKFNNQSTLSNRSFYAVLSGHSTVKFELQRGTEIIELSLTPYETLPLSSGIKITTLTTTTNESFANFILGCSQFIVAQDKSPEQKAAGLILIKEAAAAGDAGAQYFLGIESAKVSQFAEARTYYEKSMTQGYQEAQSALGDLYFNGNGVYKDEHIAFTWYERAAQLGHALSQLRLGHMIYSGRGVIKDEEKAFSWFHRAAEQNNISAQSMIGYMYATGIGTKEDINTAFTWLRKSAEAGDANGQYFLGLAYLNIFGNTPKHDKKQAGHWLHKAAEQGHIEAKNKLAQFGL